MLPKKKRITKDLFRTIVKTGRTIQSPLFVFRYIKQKTPQYAFVVSKAIAKKALDRNNLRRKGYNSLRLLDIIPNSAGIFFYKKTSKNANSTEIQTDINSILEKINI